MLHVLPVQLQMFVPLAWQDIYFQLAMGKPLVLLVQLDVLVVDFWKILVLQLAQEDVMIYIMRAPHPAINRQLVFYVHQ